MDPRCRGMILGLAVGDALGMPVEFLSRGQIEERFGPDGISGFVGGRGMFTDDTQLSMAVAEALIEAGERPLDDLMTVVVRLFVEWVNSPDNCRAPGIATTLAVRGLEAGKPWREAGSPRSKGCGSVMRTAPIAYYYEGRPGRLREAAEAIGRCTHAHPSAVAATLAVTEAAACALAAIPPAEWPARLRGAVGGLHADVDRVLEELPAAAAVVAPQEAFLRVAGAHGGSTADEVFGVACLAVLRHPGDFRAALRFAVNHSGDSDSIGCVAGALHGALLGVEGIPEEWRAGIERRTDLEDLADRFEAARPAHGIG
ncbi:MAG: ADP-ribosylglycohydrolase family protein [Elusimicrobia bacterium]|nr:ADP-ribosylglycohydrolase family protein [Elusimicrobiota bacterium]